MSIRKPARGSLERFPFSRIARLWRLSADDDETLAERFARALAAELKAVGITLDFAPVLDVRTNLMNRVIGDRALGEKAHDVARLGRAIIRGLQGEGVAACGKHFPGHGDTNADSHHELPVVEHPLERLRDVELVPFEQAIEADVAAIMTAHVLVPSLDDRAPATLSRRIVTGLLPELAYDGVILSDDLEMKALAGEHAVAPATAVLTHRGWMRRSPRLQQSIRDSGGRARSPRARR